MASLLTRLGQYEIRRRAAFHFGLLPARILEWLEEGQVLPFHPDWRGRFRLSVGFLEESPIHAAPISVALEIRLAAIPTIHHVRKPHSELAHALSYVRGATP